MAGSTSRLAYRDCYEVLDKALRNTKGIKVKVPDHGSGNNYRLRLHMARSIDRKDNQATYPEEHKLHGRSVYDPLVIRLRQEGKNWWMYVEKFSTENLEIESLGEENVINESSNGNLREAEGTSPPQRADEEIPQATEVFDGEEERPAEPAEATVVPRVQSFRRI